MKVSPTQIEKVRRCERLYSWEYVHGLKPPPSKKQQFGIGMHGQLERWLREGVPPDDSPEGRTAAQGIEKGFLPEPSPELLIEKEFSFEIAPGILVGGLVDCGVPTRLKRLGPYDIEHKWPIVIDHKSTSDLKWAKTYEELIKDPQALIYTTWAMFEFRFPIVDCRWIYYAASNPQNGSERAPKGCKMVEVGFSATDPNFLKQWDVLWESIKRAVQIRSCEIQALELKPNPEACGAFGGCPHMMRCNLSGEDALTGFFSKGKKFW